MRVVNGHIFLEVSELTTYGISRNTIDNACYRGSWESIPDERNGKKIWIKYDTLPSATKKKLPTRDELIARNSRDEVKEMQQALSKELVLEIAIHRAVVEGYVPFMSHYVKDNVDSVAMELAKAAAVLKIAVDAFHESKGFKTGEIGKPDYVKSFLEGLKKYKSERGGLIYAAWDNERYFTYKVLGAAVTGVDGITEVVKQPRKNNDNAMKITAWHRMALTRFFAEPKKYTKKQCADLVNALVKEMELEDLGIKILDEKTLIRFLDTEIENTVYLWRYGQKKFNDRLGGYVIRENACAAGDLWVVDGTRWQMLVDLGGNKYGFYDVVVVIDAYSRAIIGLAVGKNEDRWLLMKALAMSVKSTGYLPQWILFDNSSAVKNAESQQLLAKLEVSVRHSKVGNARDKVIERQFGVVQTTVMKLFDNYQGEGVLSKRKDAHPSPEHIKAVIAQAKKLGKTIPTEAEAIKQTLQIAQIYNMQADGKGKKPLEKLKANVSALVRIAEPWEVPQLFWLERKETINNRLIRMKVKTEERVYRIWDNEVLRKYDGKQVLVRYEEYVEEQDSIHVFDLQTGAYILEVHRDKKVNMVNPTEEDKVHLAKVDANRKAGIRLNEAKLQAIQDEGIEFLTMVENLLAEEELTDAEVAMDMNQAFANVRNPLKRFKNDLNDAETKLKLVGIGMDMHNIDEAVADVVPMDMTGMTPMEEHYVSRVKTEKRGKLHDKKGSGKVVNLPTDDFDE